MTKARDNAFHWRNLANKESPNARYDKNGLVKIYLEKTRTDALLDIMQSLGRIAIALEDLSRPQREEREAAEKAAKIEREHKRAIIAAEIEAHPVIAALYDKFKAGELNESIWRRFCWGFQIHLEQDSPIPETVEQFARILHSPEYRKYHPWLYVRNVGEVSLARLRRVFPLPAKGDVEAPDA